jgi:RimJ/RimL family protein N-acetyltransferase
MPTLETPRLRLVPVTLDMIEAVVCRDRAGAGRLVGATFPEGWPNDDLVAQGFPFAIDAIRAAPEIRLWGDSLVLSKEPSPRVLGSVVFHGRPEDGVAEVGYGIEDRSRGQGIATEATRACLAWALAEPGIVAVQATTFPWHHASLGVIRKVGMTRVAVREHAVLGELWVFECRGQPT